MWKSSLYQMLWHPILALASKRTHKGYATVDVVEVETGMSTSLKKVPYLNSFSDLARELYAFERKTHPLRPEWASRSSVAYWIAQAHRAGCEGAEFRERYDQIENMLQKKYNGWPENLFIEKGPGR